VGVWMAGPPRLKASRSKFAALICVSVFFTSPPFRISRRSPKLGRDVGRDWRSPHSRPDERSQTGMRHGRLSVRHKLSIALAALACAVVGCAQNVIPEPALPTPGPVNKAQNVISEPAPRPDDKSAIALDCSGLLQGWNNCLLTASKTCGSRGYTILDRSDQRPPLPEDSAFTRSMHIRCNS
jgi:hypothetical protein